MNKITKTDGALLGIVEKVNYIKIGENGDFAPATLDAFGVAYLDAVGIVYRGIAYNLDGHSEIENADTVVVEEIDAGEVFATYDELAAAYTEGVQSA